MFVCFREYLCQQCGDVRSTGGNTFLITPNSATLEG